jgi:hypothetical protein
VTRWLVGLVCAGAAGAAVLGAQMQIPTTAGTGAAPPPQGTGLILGQVVDGSSGQPVTDATVMLTAPGAFNGRRGSAQVAVSAAGAAGAQAGMNGVAMPFAGAAGGNRLLTDDQGRFVFHDLPAGSFSLTATAPGYVPGAFGQPRPNGPSHTLDLADGERKSDTKIRLWQYAVMSGTVIDETGDLAVGVAVRALRRSTVNGGARLSVAGSATTDDRGEFRIPSLVPGDYLLAIPETQVTMPVAAVQTLMDGVLSGRGAGMIDLVSSGGPLPTPEGLRVGDNLLQAAAGQNGPVPPQVDGRIGAYLTQYYPVAPSPGQATVVTLRSGEEKAGLNLQLRVAPTATVTGKVTGPNGPVANAPVKLTPVAAADAGIESGFETASTLTRADGSFTLLAVPAGQYDARATKMPRPPIPAGAGAGAFATMLLGDGSTAPSAGQTQVPLYGQTTVTASGSDVTTVLVDMHPGAKLSGRIEFVGSATPPQPRQLQGLAVSLTPLDGRAFGSTPGFLGQATIQAAADASGQFTTVGYPPGRYSVSVGGPAPPGWTLKSAVVNGKDVLTAPLELSTGDVGGAIVTYTDQVGQITGTVRGIVANATATVIVFPVDYQAWIANGMSPRRTRQSTASAAGAYTAAGLLAGDYFVVAVDDNDVSDNQDPAMFDRLARVAARVALADGDKKTADLTVVRFK